jgi:hypothetical protein
VRRVRARAREGRLRSDHDRDPRGAEVLLRRGLSPAVPAQEPGRLLRARGHRRLLRLIARGLLYVSFAVAGAALAADGDRTWRIEIDSAAGGAPLDRALLGHYDLSGALFDYAAKPALLATATGAGIGGADWRVGLGRWEAGTLLLPALTSGAPCAIPLPEAAAPPGATDLDLIAARDWFTDDGEPATLADTADDSRYALAYARSALDQALAFGAKPYLSVDLMPRALSANRTPLRDDCLWTFANRVSNVRPADPAVFAAALIGALERLRLGSGGEPGRAFTRVEIWNEPELPIFWDPSFEDGDEPLDRFFEMALTTLAALDAWRAASPHPEIQALRFGLAGFASYETALPALSLAPLDFVSFHAYADHPGEIARQVVFLSVVRAQLDSEAELVLSEWGPDLAAHASDPAYAASIEPALHAASVIATGAVSGLGRAHRSILWDFYPGGAVTLGLADHAGAPKPVQRAYDLLARMIGDGTTLARFRVVDFPEDGAALVTRDAAGRLRALFVNLAPKKRMAKLTIDGKKRLPSAVHVFDDPAAGIVNVKPKKTLPLPPRSIVVAEY